MQHPVNDCAGFFRIGDRAAAYIKLLEWRRDNPSRKLIILDMPDGHNETLSCLIARECSAEWVFGEIADEIWLVDKMDEMLPKPEAEGIYTQLIWEWWYYFNQRQGNLALMNPPIRPTDEAFQKVKELRNMWGLPERYVTIQPLFDAPYADYRNQPPAFWYEAAQEIAKEAPLVILGHSRNASLMPTPANAIPAWSLSLSVMESLALIHGSSMHVGGETGTTIWSGIFGVNTYGIYASVRYEDVWFAEPISFGGMVRINKTMDQALTARDAADWCKTITKDT